MKLMLALLIGLLWTGNADACSCSYSPLDGKAAQAARNVFVFQLVNARVDHGASDSVVGTVRVLANVRGRTTATEIRYSTSWCCGTRMEVGKSYIGFRSSDATRFDVNGGNVIPLWLGFTQDTADKLEAVLRGRRGFEEAFAFEMADLHVPPPPPAPCPVRSGKSS